MPKTNLRKDIKFLRGSIWPSSDFPDSSAGKESACNARDPSLIPGSGSSPEELPSPVFLGFPGGSDGKESACNPGHLGLIPRLGRSPEGGHINPLQYSCLENLHGQRSLGGYSPWGCKEWDTSKRLSTANSSLTESGTLTAAKTKCQ